MSRAGGEEADGPTGHTAAHGGGPTFRRLLHAGTIGAALLGLGCLLFTRHTLSATFDECNHLAAGVEWWQFGTYTMWTENPPLSRLAIAALPYLHGTRLPPPADWDPKTHRWDRSWEVGNDLLYGPSSDGKDPGSAGKDDGVERNLGRARLGTLPFFLLALGAVWLLADGRRRPAAGLVAVTLTATLPALIAHGALATTDLTFTAMFLLATLALLRWFEAPSRGRAAALGAALGLALLSKFSTLLFFPIAVAAFLAARQLAGLGVWPGFSGRPLARAALAKHAALTAVTAFLVTWAGYRFSVGRVGDLAAESGGWLQILPPVSKRTGLTGLLLRTPVPMPELFHGLRFLAAHDTAGHDAYLLGKTADHGFRAFYPVGLLVKTPLPFLLLCLATAVALARRGLRGVTWPAPALALTVSGILLLSLPSHVNLGIRHVFVVLPLAAVASARVTDARLAGLAGRERRAAAIAVGAVLVAQAAIAVGARRTELGYFNALAGRDPAAVLLDSDLDWGQDLFLLRDELRARGVGALKIAFFGTPRLCQHGLPRLEALRPGVPATGWIAISEDYYRHRSTFRLLKDPCDPTSFYQDAEPMPPLPFAWLHAYQPVAIAGSSVRLYHIADGAELPAR